MACCDGFHPEKNARVFFLLTPMTSVWFNLTPIDSSQRALHFWFWVQENSTKCSVAKSSKLIWSGELFLNSFLTNWRLNESPDQFRSKKLLKEFLKNCQIKFVSLKSDIKHKSYGQFYREPPLRQFITKESSSNTVRLRLNESS